MPTISNRTLEAYATENQIASPYFRLYLILLRTSNPAKLRPLNGTQCTTWMSTARDELPPRFAGVPNRDH